MNYKNLKTSIEETERFLKRAKELRADIESHNLQKEPWLFGSKLSASVRRASMDLTRSLAELRKL